MVFLVQHIFLDIILEYFELSSYFGLAAALSSQNSSTNMSPQDLFPLQLDIALHHLLGILYCKVQRALSTVSIPRNRTS